MPRTILAFLVKILEPQHLLGRISLFTAKSKKSERISGKFALSSLFSFSMLVDNPSTLLPNVFIATLNKSVPKSFFDCSKTNVFNFFSFPEKNV